MKCFHHNDNDGRVAAAIVKLANPDCELIECAYGKSPEALDRVEVGETVWVVDYSFPPDVFQAKLAKAGVIWIDHHATAKAYPYGDVCRGIREFEQKISGCELTWKYVSPDTPMPQLVELVGRYDSWRDPTGDAMDAMMGLDILAPSLEDKEFWKLVFNEDGRKACEREALAGILTLGKNGLQMRDAFCKDYREQYGFESTLFGMPCFVNGIFRWGSKAFGEELLAKYPLCCAYVFNGKFWTIGVYSTRPELDCGALCKTVGGGGHKGAAGFQTKDFPFTAKEEVTV